jgi:hypothetical protein
MVSSAMFAGSSGCYSQRRFSESPTCVANGSERLRPVFYLLDEGEDVGDALVGI